VSICINTDPTNPGQFFACCGLLELADRLWGGAEGWFEASTFCIRTEEPGASLPDLLVAAQEVRLSEYGGASPDEDTGESEDDLDDEVESITIVSPISLRLDWWEDKTIKPWAGSMNARKIFLAMCNAIDPQSAAPFSQSEVVFDAQASELANANSKKGKSAKKREPFYFDGQRGASAWSIDVGFSTDSLKLNTLSHPVVESMCFVGLQRCRPRPTQQSRIFDYFTWRIPVSISIVPAAVSGLIGDGDQYRFANKFRTDQKKHKAFMPAIRISRSSL
jgi:CRISPR-associated protein Csb3